MDYTGSHLLSKHSVLAVVLYLHQFWSSRDALGNLGEPVLWFFANYLQRGGSTNPQQQVTPLDVIKVRLQAQNNPSLRGKPFLDSDGLTDHVYLYENGSGKTWNRTSGRFTGMMDAFMKIVQREGVKALWSGLPPSLAVSVPTTVIYFTCYDQLHDAFISKLGEDNDYIPLIAGGIA
ncbi:Solute carrier family 25 member 40, partial [Varanus komodoensis]